MRAASDLLVRALERRGAIRALVVTERPWASATFVGAQHRMRLALESVAFLDGIEEADFDLGDYLLADILVVAREWADGTLIATLEALTIEDWRPIPSPAQPGVHSRTAEWTRSAPGMEQRLKGDGLSRSERRPAERSALLCRWHRHDGTETLLCR